ncbi:class I SAM-dependent methyltransferase [Clostridium akagii]|uniref:class I SAM-dependent methyltransferase n=1 Tax=Clostridium akagii TaxID=91623 RepID=UPI000478C0BE|nr:class I SAM-dependent methyltransferase [Clostridium akagii]
MSEIARRLKQCRKPQGEIGKVVADEMNESHFKLTTWGLQKVKVEKSNVILDIGCGGGRTVNRLAHLATDGKIYGMDYSEDCVNWSRDYNKEFIDKKKVEIIKASVEQIPFEDNKFDNIFAVETIYFWPSLIESLKEVRRVLKDTGKFIIINEMYSSESFKERNDQWVAMSDMKIFSPEELKNILSDAGFRNIEMYTVEDKNWICFINQI